MLLSRFPVEAGITPGFEVLDEQTARSLIAEARQAVLERAGSGDPKLKDAIDLLVTETSESRLGDILTAALGNDRRKVDRFFTGLGDRDFAAAVRQAHGVAEGDTHDSIAGNFCRELRGPRSRN